MAYGIKEKTTKNNTLVSWLLEKMARGVKVYLELEEISKTGFPILENYSLCFHLQNICVKSEGAIDSTLGTPENARLELVCSMYVSTIYKIDNSWNMN